MCHAQMVGASMSRVAGHSGECSNCGERIQPGEQFTRTTCKQRGQFHILVVCKKCDNATAQRSWLQRLRSLLKAK